jgi:hypothetical protein
VDSTILFFNGTATTEIYTLAVSDDGQYLYVAVSDASGFTDHIDRLRTADLGLDLKIMLPANELVGRLKVAPGAPHTLAIQLLPPSPGLLVYDDGVARGPALAGTLTALQTTFTWGADATTLFADFEAAVGSGTLVTATAAAPGPTITKSQTFAALAGLATTDMHFAGNFMFWDGGAVFDPVAYAPSAAFAFYSSGSGGNTFATAATLDASLDRAYFVTDDQALTLQGFQLSTRKLLWLARFQSATLPFELLRWGNNGLAFSVSSGPETLVLISGSLVTQ